MPKFAFDVPDLRIVVEAADIEAAHQVIEDKISGMQSIDFDGPADAQPPSTGEWQIRQYSGEIAAANPHPLTSRVFALPPGVTGSAVFSEDRLYRYVLWRDWSLLPGFIDRPTERLFAAIGMNPSAAAANVDDQTIRLLWRWAQRLGFDHFAMVNAYGLRATNPAMLTSRDIADPIGQDNDDHLVRVARQAEVVVACWGGIEQSRDHYVRELLRKAGVKPRCFGLTRQGQPLHPLRQRLPGRLEDLAVLA